MQIIVNGIIQGILFALLGVAFSMVYSTTRVFHIALGSICAVAPYLFLATFHSVGVMGGGVLSLVFCGCLGLLCEETLHWPFSRKMAPPEIHLIGSLGMFLVLGQVIVLIWGNDAQVVRVGIDHVYEFGGGLRITNAQAIGGIVGAIGLLAVFLWLQWSKLGLQLRAMADNQVLLSLMGRNVRGIRRVIFFVSGIVAALSALATSYDVGFDPNVGLGAVLVGMIATIVGGCGSLYGAALAGLILGVIRAQVVWYVSARWEETFSFLILAIILFLRPQGIFGRKLRLEETR